MQSIQGITQALNRHGIELLPEELLDAVWLIKCGMVVQGGSSEEPPQQDKPKPKSEEGPATTPQDSSESSDSQQGEGGAKPVYRPGEANDPMDSMAATRFGQSPAIARSLTVERAMRPLRSKRPNKHRRQMDEEETAILSGIAGLPIPILKPTPDRWLHITLITEVSPTMAVWQETAAQLKGLFARAASPASLRSMSMTWQPQRGITLRTEGGTRASHPVQFSGGTQLLLVVSDAMSFGWLTGAVPAQLARWAGSVNTALFQVLPPRMWPQSALRWVLENGNLPELRELRDGPYNLKQRALPVVSLHEQQMRDFAGFIKIGDEGVCAFPPGSTAFKRLNEADISSIPTFDPSKLSENEIEDRLDRFKEASFEAQLLARRLAIVGSLELPVIRLIERSLFKDASPAQFVEMLLSGVIYRVPKTGPALPETDVSNPRYKFLPGLQQRFADQCDRCARYETLRAVGNYLQWHAVGESSVSALIPSDQGNQAAIEAAPFGLLSGAGAPAPSHPELNVEWVDTQSAQVADIPPSDRLRISRDSRTRRIYVSAVSNEFKTCRERLAEDIRFPIVDVQTQEQFITQLAVDQTLLIKLDDYIAHCDAVIHLIGHQTSTDGTPANTYAIDDLIQRHSDFGVIVGLKEDELRTLSYTQWEAWLALYYCKTKRPDLLLIIATPTEAFVPDHPADAATAYAQKLSQSWHEKELQQRGRYSEIRFSDDKDLSIAVLRGIASIRPRIFISASGSEYRSCRQSVAQLLSAGGVTVLTSAQVSDWSLGQSILGKLDSIIAASDIVVHILGEHLGSAPTPSVVEEFLARHLKFGEVTGLARDELNRLSYDQWEAWLAYFHSRTDTPHLKLLAARPTSRFVVDDSGRDSHQKTPWLDHELRLQQRGIYAGIRFADAKDLSIAILQALDSKDSPIDSIEQKIAPTRLVSRHTAADFLGRDKELAALDAAWMAPTSKVITMSAWGGTGKTALLAEWIASRFVDRAWKDDEGRPDPLFYFDWTFYDQGTRADDAMQAGAASVNSFFVTALRFFGDPNPDSPQDMAARLARLIQAQRTLLILDGLEPLQYPPNHWQAGQLIDPGLHDLLATLTQRNPGLCIVSSRQPIRGITGIVMHHLDDLTVSEGIQLLRKMQIIGTDEELASAVHDYYGHALSLIVLGRFLFVKGGDIRIRQQIPLERANENRNQRITRNAWHVLEAYEQWLASPAGNAADLQALRLTGLFDRPASPDCLAALRKAPAIAGLTDQLVPLSDDAWNAVIHRLHEAQLLQLRFPPVDPGSSAPRPEAREVTVDVHPLIREYFAKHLREKQADGFKAAHTRLFDHLCARTEPRPATLEGLQPLYQAVVHGCLAGRQQETVEKVYIDRIKRGTGSGGSYSTKQLGAIGADLGAVAAFFEEPWSRLSANLSANYQAWLLNEAAFRLRALGRLTEAMEPMRVEMDRRVDQQDWKNASASASSLSELEVTLGRVPEAMADARRSIEFADRSGDALQRMARRTTAADALHQSGEREEAGHLFEQAEALQSEHQPQFDLLYSLQGFRYCDLILASAERAAWRVAISLREKSSVLPPTGTTSESSKTVLSAESSFPLAEREDYFALAEAERRAIQTLAWAQQHNLGLLDIALDHLTLARAALYRALLEPVRSSTVDHRHATAALDGLRKAGMMDHLPLALLTAALHAHLRGDADAASRALAEAQQIAERGPMPLFLADVHLHRARLFHNKAELAKARVLIEKHGYGRRKEELEDAEAAAVLW